MVCRDAKMVRRDGIESVLQCCSLSLVLLAVVAGDGSTLFKVMTGHDSLVGSAKEPPLLQQAAEVGQNCHSRLTGLCSPRLLLMERFIACHVAARRGVAWNDARPLHDLASDLHHRPCQPMEAGSGTG